MGEEHGIKLIFIGLSDMVGVFLWGDARRDAITKTTTAGCSEMLHVFYNCIKNLAPRTWERDPGINGCSGSFIGQAVALFYGVVE